VVYNDALCERERAYRAGEKVTDTEVQRRVVTLAKRTPERAWLAEVASVALVQACQDARRAYRNWFNSLSGKRRGHRIGHPRFRTKHGRQSIRLTRNGFALHGARLYVAKVGELQKGSANRAKARVRVATAYRKVRDRRADHHHKLALRLIRENQAVAVEDLCVAGLGRTRLAKSVHDAGWATFIRLLEQKAAQHGRQVVKIGRWEPTSQTCSACRYQCGPQPLGVRAWTCQACGVAHDRDVNAARNILVAAGLAETENACGADVRPPVLTAVGDEAGTRRGAA
jgi:IS605 OrfB family transposase